MNTAITYRSILACAVALSCAGCTYSQPATSPNYYPLNEGSKWHYDLKINGNTIPVLLDVAKIEVIDGEKLARVDSIYDGKTFGSEHLTSDEKGVVRHRYNGLEIKPTLTLLRLPIKPDDEWETVGTIGSEKTRIACHVSEEEVRVPAGTYQAVKLSVKSMNDDKLTSIYWFAANVGIVKQIVEQGDKNTATMELTETELAK
jgi:hypothetical protein